MKIAVQLIMVIVDRKAMLDFSTGKRVRYDLSVPQHAFDGVSIRIDARVPKVATIFLKYEMLAIKDADGVRPNANIEPSIFKDPNHAVVRRPNR